MTETNSTRVTEFILLGFSVHREIELLFLLISVVYSLTLVGNTRMISLIRLDSRLHTPMYFFLSNLAFVDLSLLTKHRSISFYACATQLGFFLNFLILEMLLLAIMTYDRYVAICNPLLYVVITSPKVCMQLVTGPYLYSFSVALLPTVVTFRLIYCGPNVINHFWCDDVPLMALTCSDTSLKEMVTSISASIFVVAGFNLSNSLLIILISYIFILIAILKMCSAEGRRKAFSICGLLYLTAVTMVYGSLFCMYLRPTNEQPVEQGKIVSVFCIFVSAMLNPFIYSLRNKDVEQALRRTCTRKLRTMEKSSILTVSQ
uniref:Olfactory receptor n=1 Tax=Sus scrofa TaxID=9823 RepID=A0A5G2QJM8_PIG